MGAALLPFCSVLLVRLSLACPCICDICPCHILADLVTSCHICVLRMYRGHAKVNEPYRWRELCGSLDIRANPFCVSFSHGRCCATHLLCQASLPCLAGEALLPPQPASALCQRHQCGVWQEVCESLFGPRPAGALSAESTDWQPRPS